MTQSQRLLAALDGPDASRGLHAEVNALAGEGVRKQDLQLLLESMLQELRKQPQRRETDEDAVLDVLDALAGWCHEKAKIQ